MTPEAILATHQQRVDAARARMLSDVRPALTQEPPAVLYPDGWHVPVWGAMERMKAMGGGR